MSGYQRSTDEEERVQPDNEGRLVKGEVELVGPRSPSRRYPPDVKERVVAWIHARLAAGDSGRQLSAFLEIPWETIDKWRGRGAVPSAVEASGAAPTKAAAALRPVKLVAAPQPKET